MLGDDTLTNEDLAPVPPDQRTWTCGHIAALWVGMAVCIPTYTMASSLIGNGMTWWQALLTVFLGNLIVLIPMTLNAHPGTAYGIPFPVLLRASFGTRGANIAALLRGVVACGWFGIQTWFGGAALYSTLAIIFGFDTTGGSPIAGLGITAAQLSCFLAFWAMNVFFIWKGMESIKWLEILSAPFLLLVGVLLMIWAVSKAGGFGPAFAASSPTTVTSWAGFGAGLTAMVGFWATLSLNIPDFSRYAKSHRDQVIGQAVALPTTMAFYSFVGIVVTGATVVIFGEAIWDPVAVVGKIGNKWLSALALIVLAVATLSTNIAANVVSPANDFSNLAPKKISFRTGGMITAFIGIFMMPWKLVADPSGYIFTWLIGYGALLGPIAGIMIADYHVLRKKHLDVAHLYQTKGIYTYTGGFSLAALAAFFLAVLPNLPGFLVQTGMLGGVHPFLTALYQQAWFVGFGLAFLLYLLFRKLSPVSIHS
ncbi:MAG: NCS1 family nucleobase:cation symporter-1 [Verrucomicrobiota bacterium]